jgi:hypothetical protein
MARAIRSHDAAWTTKKDQMTMSELNPKSQSGQISRLRNWLVAAVSLAMIVPCIWHRHIEAGDLGSHIYNAWLAQLIEKGQAPGMHIARQWNNVLVDWLMLHCANLFGFPAAEKIVVSACVLIFFWGVFGFVSAMSGRTPWMLAPCIAMLAYGYSFNMGFLNYYLSLGLAAGSLALLWKGGGAQRILGVVIVPLVILAHPLGLVWLVGTGLYLFVWAKLLKWWSWLLPVVAVVGLVAIRWYLAHRVNFPVDWTDTPAYVLNGADQLMLYGERYVWLAWAAVIIGTISFLFGVHGSRADSTFLKRLFLPAQLYVVAFCATALLPNDLRPSLYQGWIGLLVFRLTTISAIFGLCVLACCKFSKWHLAGFSAIALIFFGFLYQDTRDINVMESNAEKLFASLPYGTRLIPTIVAPEDSRIEFIGHAVDRACIGHCFTYSNYEPSSGQFRVRVGKGSPIATDSADDSSDMESGGYEVEDTDPPLVQIYQCNADDWKRLCLHTLAVGENTGQFGLHAAPPWNSSDSAK